MEPTQINLEHYNITNWLPQFKSISLKTRVIQTNLRFFQYLSYDGIYIHSKYHKVYNKNSLDLDQIDEKDTKIQANFNNPTFEAFSNKNNEDFSSNQEIMSEEMALFSEFDLDILKTLEEFENKVFVKLNWKAPKDIETWVPRLHCQSIEDIFLALKSSTIIGEMLENCFPRLEYLKSDKDLQDVGGLSIILRKWYDLNKAMEFRCFIKNDVIVGISQRYLKNSYAFLKEEIFQKRLLEKIEEFLKENLLGKFKEKSFVPDIYVEIRENNWKIWLIDINPWGNFTNPLMFKWEELEKKDLGIEFRVVLDQETIILEKNNLICQVPVEFQGNVNEESVRKWLGLLGENKGIIE